MSCATRCTRSTPFVAVRDGRITAYASSVTFWPMNHGVAESDDDMRALLAGRRGGGRRADRVPRPVALAAVPLVAQRRARLVKPMNVMALGEYKEPRGSWFPSVLY